MYGYYADVANDCQLFHVCYPVAYPDGQEEMIKWSFICPNGTIFDQVNIKVDLHMKISQSARLFICNFKSESSPVIVQLIQQTDGRTIK